jgi:hypothetical protein
MLWEEAEKALSSFLAIFRYKHEIGWSRQRIGGGTKNSSVTGVVWLVIISVLGVGEILGEVPELLCWFIVNWQVFHPQEGLLLGIVSVPYYKDIVSDSSPSFIPRWLQGDCREWFRTKIDTKMEDRCHAFLLLLVNLWAQEGVSAFQQKQFEQLLYRDTNISLFFNRFFTDLLVWNSCFFRSCLLH